MYCKHCKKEIKDTSSFCCYCGAKVEPEDTENEGTPLLMENQADNSETEKDEQQPVKADQANPVAEEEDQIVRMNQALLKRPKKIKKIVIAAVMLLVLLAGFVIGYFTVGIGISRNRYASRIDETNLNTAVEEKDWILEQWGSGNYSIMEKCRLLKSLKELCLAAEAFEGKKDGLEQMVSQKEQYMLDPDGSQSYIDALTALQTAVEEENLDALDELFQKAHQAREQLQRDNLTYVADKLKLYQSLDLSAVSAEDRAEYDKVINELKKLQNAEDKLDVVACRSLFESMEEKFFLYMDSDEKLDIQVQQVDASQFPRVKLYLDVSNSSTGEVPDDLLSSFFYISRKDANAQFVREKVLSGNQLNEEEALNVNMVIDVSSSMVGSPILQAKETMHTFLNNVQFKAGDMVELTAFSDGVQLVQEFTSDASSLSRSIDNLITGSSTSLYDALYAAVNRTAAQSGAKCVIGFTDGLDNNSNCTPDDVIHVAQRYRIPIFIVGIGASVYDDAAHIADMSGGRYWNIQDVYSMSDIYNQVYRQEKELYLLEYEDTSGMQLMDQANLQLGYKSPQYEGSCDYTFVPNTLLSVDANAVFRDGPEAVVERYMKNFDKAVTNHDLSYISDCMLTNSAIYQEQARYVTKDIKEILDSYEFVDTTYSDNDNCVITTRETFLVQSHDKPLKLLVQQCQYCVSRVGGEWKMTAFASPVKVLSKIKQ